MHFCIYAFTINIYNLNSCMSQLNKYLPCVAIRFKPNIPQTFRLCNAKNWLEIFPFLLGYADGGEFCFKFYDLYIIPETEKSWNLHVSRSSREITPSSRKTSDDPTFTFTSHSPPLSTIKPTINENVQMEKKSVEFGRNRNVKWLTLMLEEMTGRLSLAVSNFEANGVK